MGSAFAKSDPAVDHPSPPPDYLNLPCPVKYEEIQRENISESLLDPPPDSTPANALQIPFGACMHVLTFFWISAVSLKPELFEGLRFDFTKPLNQRFSLSHR